MSLQLRDVSFGSTRLFVKLLNAFAWGVAIPYTVFISTLKEIICVDMVQDWIIFADDVPQPIWLNIHRLFSVVATLCTIVAFICGIYMAKFEQFSKLHHILGFGILPLVILLHVISIIRPPGPPQGRRNITWSRWKWDVVHQVIGNMILCLGCIQLNLGVNLLLDMGILSHQNIIPTIFKGVVIAFCCVCLLIQLAKSVFLKLYPNVHFPVKNFKTLDMDSFSPDSASPTDDIDAMFSLDSDEVDDIDTSTKETDTSGPASDKDSPEQSLSSSGSD